MPRVQVEKDGRRYELEVPEGTDIAQAVQSFSGQPVASGEGSGLGAFLLRRITGGVRGLNLTTRGLVQGVTDPATWLVDQGRQAVGAVTGRDVDPRRSRDAMDWFLDRVFVPPESVLERAVTTGASALSLGGAGGSALAGRAGKALHEMPSLRRPLSAALTAVRNTPTQIGRSFRDRPKTFLALEAAGGAGSSLGADAGAASGSPAGEVVGSLVGGLGATMTPGAVASLPRLGTDAVARLWPGGATGRAARKAQRVRENPLPAEAIRTRLAAETEGVTGPRVLEDAGLMRLERDLVEDNPAFRQRVNRALQRAEEKTLTDLASLGQALPEGARRSRWQQQVFQQVSPDDAPLTARLPAAMAKEVQERFRAAYAPFAVSVSLASQEARKAFRTRLLRDIRTAVDDPGALVKKGARKEIRRWVDVHLQDWLRRDRGNLLDFRSFVRARARTLDKAGALDRRAREQATLLGNVDDVLTARIAAELSPSQQTALAALDSRYREYKTVENALNRNRSADLTPDDLDSAIRARATSAGRLARGESTGLTQQAAVGFEVRQALSKKGRQDQRLARAVEAADPAQQTEIRRQLIAGLTQRAESGEGWVRGDALLKELRRQGSTLRAGGVTDEDLVNLRRLGERLSVLQRAPGKKTGAHSEESLGFFEHLAAGVLGAHAAKQAVKATGTGGAGILMLTGAMSRKLRNLLREAKIAKGRQLLQDAMEPTAEGRKLLAALLTRGKDPLPERRAALRKVHAWFVAHATGREEDEAGDTP